MGKTKDFFGARIRQLNAIADGFFFLLAAVGSLWLAVLVVTGDRSDLWAIGIFLILIWAVLAYLVLPRLHRLLSALYVPQYFIGRSRTGDGLLGDPVNLAINGPEDNIHAVMQAAGWTQADPINLKSSLRIIGSTVTGRSYAEAPVSTLELFGRQQDFAYQQEVAGSPAQRHHVRFWRCPADWPLPGGERVEWLAAGTFDRRVGLSAFTLQVTHKIAADIDQERDHVIETIRSVAPDVSVEVLEDFSTSYHARNGGGDTIRTDGDLPVVDLRELPASIPVATELDSSTTSGEEAALEAEDRDIPRPPAVYLALVVVVLYIVAMIAWLVLLLAHRESADSVLGGLLGAGDPVDSWIATWAHPALIVVEIAAISIQVYLAWGIWAGVQGARLLLMLASALVLIRGMIMSSHFWDGGGSLLALIPTILALVLLLSLSSDEMGKFAAAKRKLRVANRRLRQRQRGR